MDLVAKLNKLEKYKVKDGFRIIDFIRFQSNEDYFLSIQASEFHCCTPQESLHISKYTHFEVAVGIPLKDLPKHWNQYHKAGAYNYVPKEEVESLLDTLDKKYKIFDEDAYFEIGDFVFWCEVEGLKGVVIDKTRLTFTVKWNNGQTVEIPNSQRKEIRKY